VGTGALPGHASAGDVEPARLPFWWRPCCLERVRNLVRRER
jgi:hypothetical protein